MNIVNLFNVTLFETMMKNSKHSVNFHFSSDEEENMNRIIRTRQGKNFDSIAEMIRNSNEYQKIKNDNLKFISISDYPPRQTINLIYRKDLFLDPILADLLDIIRDFHKNL